MKHVLLPEVGEMNYYKINLHNHTDISDGKISPEETKRRYKAHGYAAVAFTDHCVFLRHNDLTDKDFVALNGVELDVSDWFGEPDKLIRKTCHLGMIALSPDTTRPVCMHRGKYTYHNAVNFYDQMDLPDDVPDYVRTYDPDCVNDMIRRARDAGFFVVYNHPSWSLERYPQYSQYHGMHAMEIVNNESVIAGFVDEENAHCYDDLLNLGNRIFCVATDDGHHHRAADDPFVDEFGGYVLAAAKDLTYTALTDALLAGRFFSGTGDPLHEGPRITGLTYEDGVISVKASGARYIFLSTEGRCRSRRRAAEGETVDETTFTLPEGVKWFRLTLRDERGFSAYSNAYFTDELR